MAHNAIMTIGEKNKTPSKFQEISLTIQKTIDKAMICKNFKGKIPKKYFKMYRLSLYFQIKETQNQTKNFI